MVDHSDDLPCRGVYFLHHGLQRRIRITIVHDRTKDLKWKDVRELVVGRIRVTPESDIDDDLDGSVLSLGLFPGKKCRKLYKLPKLNVKFRLLRGKLLL